ncbi:MAG: sugar transferase [Tunicatimonas sp.]
MNEVTYSTTPSSVAEGPHFIHRSSQDTTNLAAPAREMEAESPSGYPGKRLLDIMIASVALVLLSPLFLLIALAIVLESRGPAFYVAQRMGSRYRIFEFYKFRTMRPGADQLRDQLWEHNHYGKVGRQCIHQNYPFFFKIKGDPRVTWVGRFLRKTSLDELPQLINVLRGDMSLVGNRPLPLDEAATLMAHHYTDRFLAPAGITGLWQISENKDDMRVAERVALDLRYGRECSLSLDWFILLRTLWAMWQQE